MRQAGKQKVINLQLLFCTTSKEGKKIISLDGFVEDLKKIAPAWRTRLQSSGKSMKNDGVKLIRL